LENTLFPGVRLPLVQAPMAGVQGAALAAAVCEAGALGSLPAAMLTAQTLDNELRNLEALTQRPYNVNFFAIRRLHHHRTERTLGARHSSRTTGRGDSLRRTSLPGLVEHLFQPKWQRFWRHSDLRW